MPQHGENHEGRGTPLPLRALALLPASAARAPLAWHRCSHLEARHHHRGPLARGLPGRRHVDARTDPMTGIIRRANTPARANVANHTTTDCAGASRNFSEHQERMNVEDHRGSNAARQCHGHPDDHRVRTRAVHGRITITHASRQDGDRATTASSLGSPALRRRLSGDVAGFGSASRAPDGLTQPA